MCSPHDTYPRATGSDPRIEEAVANPNGEVAVVGWPTRSRVMRSPSRVSISPSRHPEAAASAENPARRQDGAIARRPGLFVTLLPRPARKAARPHQRYARGAPRRPHHHRYPRASTIRTALKLAFFSGLGAAFGRGRGDVLRLHGTRTTTSFLRSVVPSRLEGVRAKRTSCRRVASLQARRCSRRRRRL